MPYELKREDIFGLAMALNAETKEKGDELFFKYCPYCGGGSESFYTGGGHDKNTFSINLTTGAFHCFRASCGRSGHFVEMARDFGYHLDMVDTPKKYRPLPQKPIVVRNKAIEYLTGRGISRETVEKYQITTQTKNENILVFPFYDENNILTFIKYRDSKFVKYVSANKEWCETGAKPILFGMNHCTDFERLVITEGQIDSLTVADCGISNAVSVPTGCKGFQFLDTCWEWLTKFSEIVVFGDCEKGKITLLDTLVKRIPAPTKVKGVRVEDYLGEKDANDILRKYGKQAVITAVENAVQPPVNHVKELADVEAVDLNALPKIQTGIKEIDRIIGGLYLGQVILLTGKRGEGKSTLLSQMIVEALDQNFSVFAYSGELADYHFKRWLDFQAAGPDNIVTNTNVYGEEYYQINDSVIQKINNWYRGRAYIYDNTAVEDDEMQDLLETIEHCARRYDIKLVCVDNLMTVMNSTDENLYRKQSEFVKQLKKIAVQYNLVIILVAHPKKTQSAIENDDVSGSADITNRVDVVMSYCRNKDKINPDDVDAADSKLSILKNRLTGKLTRAGEEIELYYSQKSKRITSISSEIKKYGWEKQENVDPYDWLIDD